jgi:hypothetical protein
MKYWQGKLEQVQYCKDIKSLKIMFKMFQNDMYGWTHNAHIVVFSFPLLFFLTLSSYQHQHKGLHIVF